MNSLLNIVTDHALSLVLAIVLALLIHEAGHYITARLFGEKLKFEFNVAKLKLKHLPPIPILRFTMDIPEAFTKTQHKICALSGFGLELLVTALLFIFVNDTYLLRNYYISVTVLHLILYPKYAGESNDFTAYKNAK